MRLKDIGEFGLIKRFQSKIKTDASVIKGTGFSLTSKTLFGKIQGGDCRTGKL